MERTLPVATTPGQSGTGSDGNEEILCIHQNSCITGTSPSESLMSYSGQSLREACPSAKKQAIHSKMIEEFYFKQFGLAYVCSLNVTNVLFQAILFSICTQTSSLSLIDWTQFGATFLLWSSDKTGGRTTQTTGDR